MTIDIQSWVPEHKDGLKDNKNYCQKIIYFIKEVEPGMFKFLLQPNHFNHPRDEVDDWSKAKYYYSKSHWYTGMALEKFFDQD